MRILILCAAALVLTGCEKNPDGITYLVAENRVDRDTGCIYYSDVGVRYRSDGTPDCPDAPSAIPSTIKPSQEPKKVY